MVAPHKFGELVVSLDIGHIQIDQPKNGPKQDCKVSNNLQTEYKQD